MIMKKGPPLGNAEIMKDSMSQVSDAGRLRDLFCAQLGDLDGPGLKSTS